MDNFPNAKELRAEAVSRVIALVQETLTAKKNSVVIPRDDEWVLPDVIASLKAEGYAAEKREWASVAQGGKGVSLDITPRAEGSGDSK